MKIAGLRSDREGVGGLVFFGRMLDKIRLHATGNLPADYNRGHGFDGRMGRFLRVDYTLLVKEALAELDDLKVLEWCFMKGYRPSADEIFVFNAFLSKRGWQDDVSGWVKEQKKCSGWRTEMIFKQRSIFMKLMKGESRSPYRIPPSASCIYLIPPKTPWCSWRQKQSGSAKPASARSFISTDSGG